MLLYSAVGNSLIFPISFALLPKFDAGKPGSETGINLKAGMRVKYMGSKSWLAPHVGRLLGDVAVLHSLLLEARQSGASTSPSAGHSERPRRAPGRLLIRPAAQQLLGKVGLLHTAAPAGAEQRAAYAAATAQL